MAEAVESRGNRWSRRTLKSAAAAGGLLLFVLALQLLKEGASGLGPFVRDTLDVSNAANALGFGWIMAYVVMSGSPVAAMALTLFVTEILTDVQTFLAITGSRLGASFVVLAIGFAYRLRGHGRHTSLQMGVLALLVTYTVYVPAAFFGYWLLTTGALDGWRLAPPGAVMDVIDVVFDPLVEWAAAVVPGVGLFLVGFGFLLAALKLFDEAIPDLSGAAPRNIESVIFRPFVMFGVGLVVTLFTMSVSVSLGLLVPLSAKGIARRENIIPYILGANVSTFIDTLVASLLLDAPRAATIVIAEILSVAAISLLLLAFGYRYYERTLLAALDRVLHSTRRFVTFLVIILAIPLVLMLV